MWNFGDLKIDGRVVLGPMSGVTSGSYRDFMAPFGIAFAVTEMVSDMGVIHDQIKTHSYLDFNSDYMTGLQLFGHEPEDLALAAETALSYNPNISFIDVNMGCPVHKVIRNGCGSALMREPKRCGDIIRAIKSRIDVPVSAKIRLGWSRSEMNYREVIDELMAAEVDLITIHPRLKDEQYYSVPHYDLIKGLRSEISVPLVVSGNIRTVGDAANAVEITGADAVMVARGGVGNPFLVTQIDTFFRTGEVLQNPIVSEQVDWCLKLIDMTVDEKGEDAGIRRLRSLGPKFVSGFYGSRNYREKLVSNDTDLDTLRNTLLKIKEEHGHRRINTNYRQE